MLSPGACPGGGGGARGVEIEKPKKKKRSSEQILSYLVSQDLTKLVSRGAKQGGGVGGSQPPLNFGWGVEHLSTPPDFEKKNLGGLAPLKLI